MIAIIIITYVPQAVGLSAIFSFHFQDCLKGHRLFLWGRLTGATIWGPSLRGSISLSVGCKEPIHYLIILLFSYKESGSWAFQCGLLDRNKAVPFPARSFIIFSWWDGGTLDSSPWDRKDDRVENISLHLLEVFGPICQVDMTSYDPFCFMSPD